MQQISNDSKYNRGFTILRRSSGRQILSSSKGFTIVELLVVIVVIGILAAITIVSYTGITNRATVAAIQSDLSNNSNILKMYYTTYGSYPTTLSAYCPATPTVDDSYCLKSSGGVSISYQPSAVTGAATDFTLYASKNSAYYRVSSDAALTTQAVSKVCPYGFIVVPGSATYSTSDFCVMKYEAKQVGTSTTPISTAAGLPWVNISQTTASTNSANVASCTGCHLITEAEWMTITQNVLSVASNWRDNVVGTGGSSANYVYSGHNDNAPANALAASTDDTDGYFGTGQTTGSSQRRTLTLTNGEVIWDLAGNVYDWTAGQTTGGQPGLTGEVAYAWKQWNAITAAGSLAVNATPAFGTPAASAWTSTNGIGQLNSYAGEAGLRGFVRGGTWGGGSFAGVLALGLGIAPSGTNTSFGFRVAASSGL